MAKYSFEFKKKVVMEYLDGGSGYEFLSKKYIIPDKSIVRHWINSFKAFGDEGIMRSRQNKKYTFEYKLHVVELYLTTDVSYQELAIQEGITNYSMIANWVRYYRAAGPDGLRPRKRGRKKTLSTHKKDIKSKNEQDSAKDNTSIDTSAEHVKELEDELLKLRIENAFLKESRRLRLEEEAKMRERRESSPVSEDNSN